MLKSCIAVVLVSICCAAPLLAQRIVTTVPAPEDEAIRFDVNDFPLTNLPYGQEGAFPGLPRELNFGPNIVFAPDSRRAFVSFPGSSKVMAFDAVTAEVLAMIEVGPNPGLLTMSPDGTTLGVVSHFLRANVPSPEDGFRSALVGAISFIDVGTYEVRTLDLEDVFFSFGNNVVFSADSRWAYVASAGTDSLLRFDVATLTEMTPRLSFEGGTRPASITMAPDQSYMAVVLVGSSGLAQSEIADSIQLVNPATFRVMRSIEPDPLQVTRSDGSVVRIPHSFFATNNLAISSDGKFGLIADQENSGASVVPSLTADHALLIDMETGEILNTLSVGGVATTATYAPQLGVFVLLSAISATFIDPVNETLVTSTSSFSQFRPSSRPAFFPDGNRAALPSPVVDSVSVVDMRTGATRNLVSAGVDYENENVLIPAGTLEMTISPDAQILAALNFNANTIDLMKNTSRIAIPEFVSNSEFYTGVAITNNSPDTAEIMAGGVSASGIPYFDDPDTEDVVEFVNPQMLELGPGRQTAFTAGNLLETSEVLDGWLDLDTDVSQLSSFFLTGDYSLHRLDGGLSETQVAQALVIPGVSIERGFRTSISVVNTNLNGVSVSIALVNSQAEAVFQVSQTLGPSGVLRRFLVDSNPDDNIDDGLFAAELFEEGETYYVGIAANQGVIAYLRYYDDERMAAMNAIPVAFPDLQLPTRLFAPQAVFFGGAGSRLNLVNNSTETAMVTVALRGDEGQDLADPVTLEMESGTSREDDVATLFQLADPGGVSSGWLAIDTDQAGVVGSVEIQVFGGRAMSIVPTQLIPSSQFVFSHVAEGFGFATGLSLVNPGEEDALVNLRVSRPDGLLVGEAELALPAGNRRTRLLSELFPDLPELAGGYIRVESSRPIVGLELFYGTNQETLASVPAQSLASGN